MSNEPQHQTQVNQYYSNVIDNRIDKLMKQADNSTSPASQPTLPPQTNMPFTQKNVPLNLQLNETQLKEKEAEWKTRGHGIGSRVTADSNKKTYRSAFQKIPVSNVMSSSLSSLQAANNKTVSTLTPPPLLATNSGQSVSPTFEPSTHLGISSQSISLASHIGTIADSPSLTSSPEYLPSSKRRRISSGGRRSTYSPQRPGTYSAQRNLFCEEKPKTEVDHSSSLILSTSSLSKAQSSLVSSLLTANTLSESMSRTKTIIPSSSTPDDCTTSEIDDNITKDINLQAGPSMLISVDSAPSSTLPKRSSSYLDGEENTPTPKTVRIAPFNRTITSDEPVGVSEPEAISVVTGGKTTLCHPHPVSASSVPPAQFPPGTRMKVTEGGFVACVPTSCAGKFSPHRMALHQSNCKCHAHIRAQMILSSKDQTKGSKTEPVVIDSDDEDIQIVKDIPATKEKAPSEQASKGHSNSPKKEPEPSDSTQHLSPKETMAQKTSTHLSPRQRAKMSADHHNASIVPPPIIQPPEDTLSLETVGLSLANVVSKMSKRMRLNEQSDGNSSSSSTTESESMPESMPESIPNPDVNTSILSNPEKLVQMLQECKRVRPYKRLRVTGRNLFQAAKSRNLEKVIALLVEGCRANAQVESEKGRTALHAAAAGGYMDIMKVLRMVGGDLDVLDYDMRTPLFDAIENHQIQAMEYLLQCGASLRVKDQGGMTLLHLAARRGYTDIINTLLNTGVFDINQKDDGGWTAIMWAAEDKHVGTTKQLINKGGSVHMRDLELNIPLHWAAFAGSQDISLLLLNEHSEVNSVNKHGETPLHIATREDNFACVQLLLNRGARIDITNRNGMTPLEVAYAGTKSQKLIEANKMLILCQPKGKYRLLSSDITRGQENVAIPCVNEVDNEPCPDFHFVKESCEVGGSAIQWNINTMESCSCEGDCRNGVMCQCANHSAHGKIWYTQDGLLSNEIHKLDRPLIFECNRLCKCWSYCRNRVIQKGMQYPLQLFKTKRKGWGVRALSPIPQGTFLCEYTGELISDTEADLRNDDTFLFDLDCKESDQELFCIDAFKFGNISRFINHSCEPNCTPTRVFINHQDIRFPRIAFFSSKDIEIHQEICFDYGDRFWEVKKDEFFCQCGTTSCNYRAPDP